MGGREIVTKKRNMSFKYIYNLTRANMHLNYKRKESGKKSFTILLESDDYISYLSSILIKHYRTLVALITLSWSVNATPL